MQDALKVLKALSDRNRLRAFAVLRKYDELCACQIIELLGVTGATVSRHLGILQEAGLVSSRKDGRWVHYRCSQPVGCEQLIGWLDHALHESADLKSDLNQMVRIMERSRESICTAQRKGTENE